MGTPIDGADKRTWQQNFFISHRERQALRVLASREDMSVSAYLRHLLREAAEKHGISTREDAWVLTRRADIAVE